MFDLYFDHTCGIVKQDLKSHIEYFNSIKNTFKILCDDGCPYLSTKNSPTVFKAILPTT
jgi:hypothetical protein